MTIKLTDSTTYRTALTIKDRPDYHAAGCLYTREVFPSILQRTSNLTFEYDTSGQGAVDGGGVMQ